LPLEIPGDARDLKVVVALDQPAAWRGGTR